MDKAYRKYVHHKKQERERERAYKEATPGSFGS